MIPNNFVWMYYTFISEFKIRPADIDELCDGLNFIRAKNKAQEIYVGE